MSGIGNAVKSIGKSGNSLIDGVLTGHAWAGQIDYSFATNTAAYQYTTPQYQDIVNNAFLTSAAQRNATHFALNADVGSNASSGFSLEGFTNVNVFHQSAAPNGQHEIRIANTTSNQTPTAQVTDFPGNYVTGDLSDNGDVWFGNANPGVLTSPQAGNYAWVTTIHELGHAVGLSHGHTSFFYQMLPAQYDSMEYSVMTYRSYIGGPTNGYTNETWGFAQTWMMADIAALQYMYGADFSANSGNTTYKWAPNTGQTFINSEIAINPGGNRIFATIWDGNGIDTYDLSLYSNAVNINLAPGASSTFSTVQLANLGGGNDARGNIFNALLYKGNQQSLIENAVGGSGSDTIVGNVANNALYGNDGLDKLFGMNGNDRLYGQNGNDTLNGMNGNDLLKGGEDNDTLNGGNGNDLLYGDNGVDTLNGMNGNDTLYGGNGGDSLWGNANNDRIYGGNDSDLIAGGTGNDLLFGGNHMDTIYGEAGFDNIYGGGGNDWILPGTGGDIMFGGPGSDTFYMVGGMNGNVIKDFNAADANEDVSFFYVNTVNSYAQLVTYMSITAQGLMMNFGNGHYVLLEGIFGYGQIDSSDFSF